MTNNNTMKSVRISEIKSVIVPMSTLEPLEIGRIVTYCEYKNHYVMRTASSVKFEVMDLTDPAKDHCWVSPPNESIEVELISDPFYVVIGMPEDWWKNKS